MDKHSSLLRKFVNYRRFYFYNIGQAVVIKKSILRVNKLECL